MVSLCVSKYGYFGYLNVKKKHRHTPREQVVRPYWKTDPPNLTLVAMLVLSKKLNKSYQKHGVKIPNLKSCVNKHGLDMGCISV